MGKTTRERLETCDKTAGELESSLRGLREGLKKAIEMVEKDETIEDVNAITEAIIDKLMLAGTNIVDAGYMANDILRKLVDRKLNKAFNTIRVVDAVRKAIEEIRKLKAEAAEK